ncbi:MAG: TIR domain-containing protein [Desulfobacteraceae bacterium]|nr:TIR domain-containing protein [Desulfobacteraceae bacterium]
MEPKVFISYSWSNQSHQELVEHWADRLISEGIDVVLDIYDLKEGHEK